ncbi:hypothetical protein ACHAXM_001105 [Skeletonema potamos]
MAASARLVAILVVLPQLLCLSLLSPYPCRQPTQIYVADPTGGTESDKTNTSSSPPIQQKRRRRKANSFFLTSQSTNDESPRSEPAIVTPLAEKPLEAKSAECPFAMTFPRYRVNISNNKNANNDPESEKRRSRRVQRGIINKLVSNLGTIKSDRKVKSKEIGEGNPWGVVSSIVQGVFQSDTADNTNKHNHNNKLRKSTEAIYATEIKEGLFRWVSSVESTESSPLTDEDFVAAAAFWRMASDIVQREQNEKKKKWYLALPETTQSVASNLCDILNWYAELEKKEDDSDASMQIIAQLDSRSDVPVIQFTASGNSQKLQQQPNTILPSAADTERQTKAWVKRLLVELGVCPFTKSPEKSGQGLGDLSVPVANIMYRHSDALSGESGGVYLVMAGE